MALRSSVGSRRLQCDVLQYLCVVSIVCDHRAWYLSIIIVKSQHGNWGYRRVVYRFNVKNTYIHTHSNDHTYIYIHAWGIECEANILYHYFLANERSS